MKRLRVTVACPACGGPVGLKESECPYCGSKFEVEKEEIKIDPYNLPDARNNPHAADDALLLKPFLDEYSRRASDKNIMKISEFIELLEDLAKHSYSATMRRYILELRGEVHYYLSICLSKSREREQSHLEIFLRAEAIYKSLNGEGG